MKIIFAGTENFSIPSLKHILENFDLRAIITKPDKPRGRGLNLKPYPVKEFGLKNKIPVFQPVSLTDEEFLNSIKKNSPDFVIEVAFGRIFPDTLLSIPKECSINIHPSLLPGYKGPSPLRWVLANNEKETGVTAHIMTSQIDSGKIIFQKKIKIDENDNYGTLYEKLSKLSAEIIPTMIERYYNSDFIENLQDTYTTKGFYARKMEHIDFKINWQKSAKEINNMIRAATPQPGLFTLYNGRIIKIFEAEVLDQKSDLPPGSIIKADTRNGLLVSTGKGLLKIIKLQKENKKVLYYKDFLNGFKFDTKERLN